MSAKRLSLLLAVLMSSICGSEAQVIPLPVKMEFRNGVYIDMEAISRIEMPERLVPHLDDTGFGHIVYGNYVPGTGTGKAPSQYQVLFREDMNQETRDMAQGPYMAFRFVSSDEACDSLFLIPESYRLTVSKDSIVAEAAGYAGLFYALQTVRQLVEQDRKRIPCVCVEGYPRYEWRGFMLDVSRHFFDADFIRKQIDAMALLKLNRLHLHLTDAAGWRIETESYPLLASFAAWRTGSTWKEWWFGDRKYLHEGTSGAYGGYYTKGQLKEIVEYAAARNICIVPEIEMPSHSEEVLAAYPGLSCTGEAYRHSDFCIGKEETFAFLRNVLAEVMEIFPSEFIHVGGDEANKQAWKECPDCMALMAKEGIESVDGLQSYLLRRIGKYLEDNGRTLVGWDEILQGGMDTSAVVMAWRGVGKGLEALSDGHRTIMSPGAYCYFDTYQDAPEFLPEAMGGYLPLSKVYSFDPEEALSAGIENNLDYSGILGVQANLWTEYIPAGEHAEMMVYPRLYAISEIAWSRPESKDYEDFHKRALLLCERMSGAGYNVFDLANEFGNRPAALCPVRHKALGCKVIYNAPFNSTYAAAGETALTDGLKGGWTYSDGRWQGFISRKRMDVTVDLGKVARISSVELDFMQVCGPEVFLPAEVAISLSEDGKNFTEVRRIERDVVRDDKVTFVTDSWRGKARCRYVRVEARSGQFGGWVFSDEIVIK